MFSCLLQISALPYPPVIAQESVLGVGMASLPHPSKRRDLCVSCRSHTSSPELVVGTISFIDRQNSLRLALVFFQPQLQTLLYPECCPPAALPVILVLPFVLRWCSACSAILP